jgi:hypothetical protein
MDHLNGGGTHGIFDGWCNLRIRTQRDFGEDQGGHGGGATARAACGRLPKLAPDQLDYARRMIGERIGRVQAARSLGVDRPTLRRLLMEGETW